MSLWGCFLTALELKATTEEHAENINLTTIGLVKCLGNMVNFSTCCNNSIMRQETTSTCCNNSIMRQGTSSTCCNDSIMRQETASTCCNNSITRQETTSKSSPNDTSPIYQNKSGKSKILMTFVVYIKPI